MTKSAKQPLFTYAKDWHNNACINGFYADHYAYSEGYRQAADLLIAHIAESHSSQDTLVYPIVFLYRHHVELMLKKIISTALDLVDLPERYKQKTDNHNFNTLWPMARSLVMDIDKTFPKDNYATLDAVVKAFIESDARATAFRYARNNSGQPSLAGMQYINTRHFGEMMSKASYELDCMDSHLLHLRGLQNEQRADWGY
ncbi:hypothetical protein CWS43_23200 [Rahnella sp. AA]|uniref:hypothetical protein n=1 Tax=Rahnella sp. AA TaxID=2057180 RepID=UPI000C347FC0|nr:hypothetical protein [Rahnella sp. AA]PKE28048.1 hypothetical protein CWS43_23200 [Rahnella sp. AA]